MVKRWARVLRHLPDRLLHPWRRRRERARLEAFGNPERVLFICHGNINRSAYGAAALERALAERGHDGVRIRSAGFIGPGRPSPEIARAAGLRRGVDLAAHVSRLVEAEEVRGTDLVVVMNASQARRIRKIAGGSHPGIVVLGDLDPLPIERRGIQDPYSHTTDVFDRVFEQIDRCIEELTRIPAFNRSRAPRSDPAPRP